jgi:adenylate cyclase class 2
MPDEIEAKIRITDPEALRRQMAARGLVAGGTVLEINRLFDDGEDSLTRSGSALRLREERPLEGGAARRTLLTYKGPREPSRMKRRSEIETSVGAAEPMAAILEAMGLVEAFRYEKRRTTWNVGDCEVVLDEVPYLGWYAEVEGPTEEAVLKCLADLGLKDRPIITESYITLLVQCLMQRGADPTKAVFSRSI